jgi:hypothetical protein
MILRNGPMSAPRFAHGAAHHVKRLRMAAFAGAGVVNADISSIKTPHQRFQS